MHGERPVHKLLAKALLASAASLLLLATPAMAKDSGAVRMQRLYNPNSGEHFYTANTNERDHLVNLGWSYEGVGWVAPSKSRIPVYRLYNPNAGDHHYTMNAAERDMLVKVGWNYEGIGWYSSEAQTVSLYRQYNPQRKDGDAQLHHEWRRAQLPGECWLARRGHRLVRRRPVAGAR
jgi:hypothetical protein